MLRAGAAALLLLCALATAAIAQAPELSGWVTDATGAPIRDASIATSNAKSVAHTDSAGHFALRNLLAPQALSISAEGFAPVHFLWHRGDPPRTWRLVPTTVLERVTVIGKDRTLSTFDNAQLRNQPAFTLDAMLRQVPGFTLFRRTPSWSANPTAQGVSLRGVGASGASRATVLLNGISLNDPFGGWIYWGRVPPELLDQAVVVQGAASDLFGTQAVGGAVELFRDPAEQPHFGVTDYFGNLATPSVAATGNVKLGKNWLAGGLSLFRTAGYVPVQPSQRGPVDTVTNSEDGSGWVRLERESSAETKYFLEGDLYGESRQNGTQLQVNSATVRDLRLGADWTGPSLGALRARIYGGTENLSQTFSAITPDRTAEALTRDQSVPVSDWGVVISWAKSLSRRNQFFAGADTAWIEGDSEEWAFAQGARSSLVLNGGSQWRTAGFGEDKVQINSRTLLSVGARFDYWRNQDARTATLYLAPGVPLVFKPYPDRSEVFASPRLGVEVSVTRSLVLHAAISRAFRAPTLNELYRGFRIGNVLTLANPALSSEKELAFETGATFAFNTAHSFRATYFLSSLNDPITNYTLSVTPGLITRQRANLGSLRSEGMELDWDGNWNHWLSTEAGYQYVSSVVSSFPPDNTLVGLSIPQVPRHSATAEIRLVPSRRTFIALTARGESRRYDDDRNLFPLGGFFVADGYISRVIKENLQVFAAVENIFDRRYEVGKTPVTTVGPPILARVGLRYTFNPK